MKFKQEFFSDRRSTQIGNNTSMALATSAHGLCFSFPPFVFDDFVDNVWSENGKWYCWHISK